LLQRKRFFILLLIVAFAWGFGMEGGAELMMGYLVLIMALFCISSISYDEYDNCYAFLLTLPIDKKVYVREKYLFGFVLSVIGWLVGAVIYGGYMTMNHIQERVAIWKDPFADAGDMGYQIVQSLYAMASGGFMGSGLGQGSPDLIPVVKSDFIFSAIYEEFGMLGATAVIMLFFLLVYRGIKISLRCTNTFNKALTLGLSLMFGFQTFIIIGGVTKFIPMTGITLPFMSAGGSSLAASFIALAILQAVSGRKEDLSDDI